MLPSDAVPRTSGHLDGPEVVGGAATAMDQELAARMRARLEGPQLDLPHLPSTVTAIIEMASDPNVDIDEIVNRVEDDPALSTELLRLAGSAAFGSIPATTLKEAIVRVGLRTFKSMVFARSLRTIVFRDPTLDPIGSEVWRQSFSHAHIGRAIAPILHINRDYAFLVCLLADIGKAALLHLLHQELQVEPALREHLDRRSVGRLLFYLHEEAGTAISRAWNLSDEFGHVAGGHHDFAANIEEPHLAALVSLVHRIDLSLSTEPDLESGSPLDSPEVTALAPGLDQREALAACLEFGHLADSRS